jgi:hypothetical protein
MSARAIVKLPGQQLPAGEEGASNLPLQDEAQSEVLSTPLPEGSLGGREESARFADELLRRYDILLPMPLPWRHGGINE